MSCVPNSAPPTKSCPATSCCGTISVPSIAPRRSNIQPSRGRGGCSTGSAPRACRPCASCRNRPEPMALQLDGDLYQIGVVVRDLERGMAQYRDLLGLGPFLQMETHYRARYRDWTGTIANRNA